ncbi:MAG: large conductance mechanosensitive channel protein MscL [Paludibacteraceae bacterium]|nr:large conductance mechanosensitive channel protein MscL [Paludibacteraceae bacterium]
MKGFIEFIREQGVVGLAIGFILGGAVSKVVSALVTDLINPVLGLVLGAVGNLSDAMFKIGSAEIKYGHFITVLIDFVVVAFVVYYIFKGLEKKIDKKK